VWPRGWVEVYLYSSMSAALEGGEWSASRRGRTSPPGKIQDPFYRRLSGPQGRSGRAENLVPTGIRSRTVQPVAQSLYRLSYPAHSYLVRHPNFVLDSVIVTTSNTCARDCSIFRKVKLYSQIRWIYCQ
jgi:hypothetical protein